MCLFPPLFQCFSFTRSLLACLSLINYYFIFSLSSYDPSVSICVLAIISFKIALVFSYLPHFQLFHLIPLLPMFCLIFSFNIKFQSLSVFPTVSMSFTCFYSITFRLVYKCNTAFLFYSHCFTLLLHRLGLLFLNVIVSPFQFIVAPTPTVPLLPLFSHVSQSHIPLSFLYRSLWSLASVCQ